MGADADAEPCSRKMERTESGACDHTTAEVAEKERENPGTVSGGLRSVLPICMGWVAFLLTCASLLFGFDSHRNSFQSPLLQ